VFPADAEFDVRVGTLALCHGDFHELPDSGLVNGLERVTGEDLSQKFLLPLAKIAGFCHTVRVAIMPPLPSSTYLFQGVTKMQNLFSRTIALVRRSDAPTLRRSDAPTLRRSDAPTLRRS
jgi:hypothetical protein